MAGCCRHYKALMRKNFLQWMRTPCGTFCEILFPVLLMMIIVLTRSVAEVEFLDNFTLYSLRHPLYPVAKPGGSNSTFSVDLTDQASQITNYQSFMNYTDYLNLNDTYKVPVNVSSVIEVLLP